MELSVGWIITLYVPQCAYKFDQQVARKGRKKHLNIKALANPVIGNALQDSVTTKLQTLGGAVPSVAKDTKSLTREWSQISKCIMEISIKTLGYSSRKHRDWFDEKNMIIRNLLKVKNEAHVASIHSLHIFL